MLDNRLELDAQTELPLGDHSESIDFPARHRLSRPLRASSASVALSAAYEIADGENVDSRTARLGFDLAPWAGARIALSGNVQDIAEYGPRSFAAFGLSQSLVLSKHWSVDVTLDGNRTLGGIDPARVLNPLHPVASGGFVGGDGTLTEDFTALTAGATWRADRWSVTGRAEYRDGERENRYGITVAALRQIGEGGAVGGALNWFTAEAADGAETRTANLQLTWAHRPPSSALVVARQVRAARGPGDRRRRRQLRTRRLAAQRSPATRARGGWSTRSRSTTRLSGARALVRPHRSLGLLGHTLRLRPVRTRTISGAGATSSAPTSASTSAA